MLIDKVMGSAEHVSIDSETGRQQVSQPGDRGLPLRVLVIGDNLEISGALSHVLKAKGWEAISAGNTREAGSFLSESVPDVALVDVDSKSGDALGYVRDLRERFQDLGIIAISEMDSAAMADSAVRAGADNLLTKPIAPWALTLAVSKLGELRRERQRVHHLQIELSRSVRDAAFPDIVTNCDAMKAVLSLVEKVSPRDLSVLICGESGTGKELVARAIHQASPRASSNFIELNCAALPPNLVESELFGHERGAFTGAVTARAGKIEQAHGGTLFLDEIGELPLEIQPKLLRSLQERRITRIGGRNMVECDFRLVSATNRDLVQEVRTGRFREDLFYRVAVFPVKLPPLRERIEDLELLLSHFLKLEDNGHFTLSPGARDLLAAYHWPGNVRELKNFSQAITLLSDEGVIDEPAVQAYFGSRLRLGNATPTPEPVSQPKPVRRLEDVEREEIMNAIQYFKGNVPEAARALGMGRATLYKYLNRAVTQYDE